jgi:hypothetical protein
VTGRDFLVTGNAVECCTLTAAVRPKKAKDLPWIGLEVDTSDGLYELPALEDPREYPRVIA